MISAELKLACGNFYKMLKIAHKKTTGTYRVKKKI